MPIIKAAAVGKFFFIRARVRFLWFTQWMSRGCLIAPQTKDMLCSKLFFLPQFEESTTGNDVAKCLKVAESYRCRFIQFPSIQLLLLFSFSLRRRRISFKREKVRVGKIYGARWQHKFDFNFSCLNRGWNRKCKLVSIFKSAKSIFGSFLN